ncbi:MAG: hypothetical protein KKD44_23730 [Proteobacteria bacterium]|nr:hypothetical protein [Pseudomonadota bacterium]
MRDAFGVLVQIAEFEADDWLAPSVRMAPGKTWDLSRTENGCTLKMAHPGGGIYKKDLSRDDVDALIRDLEAMR